MSNSSRRENLTLRDKITIIEVASKEKLSTRGVAAKFGISKTQAAKILKYKEEFLKMWRENGNPDSKRKFLNLKGRLLDAEVLEWLQKTRLEHILISGSLIRKKALEISKKLKMDNFKASQGWLEKFRKRHNISIKRVHGGHVEEILRSGRTGENMLCGRFHRAYSHFLLDGVSYKEPLQLLQNSS